MSGNASGVGEMERFDGNKCPPNFFSLNLLVFYYPCPSLPFPPKIIIIGDINHCPIPVSEDLN